MRGWGLRSVRSCLTVDGKCLTIVTLSARMKWGTKRTCLFPPHVVHTMIHDANGGPWDI